MHGRFLLLACHVFVIGTSNLMMPCTIIHSSHNTLLSIRVYIFHICTLCVPMSVPAFMGCMYKPLLPPWGLEPGRETGTQWRFSTPCTSLVVFSLLLCSHLSELHRYFRCEWRVFPLSLEQPTRLHLHCGPFRPRTRSFWDSPEDSWESLSVCSVS